jgi:hypothetical protein
MLSEVERIARWRMRATKYRARAEASESGGEKLAFQALAESADGVADQMENGTLTQVSYGHSGKASHRALA